MSFRCGICGVQQEPRSKATRVVTETREKIYPERRQVHQFKNKEGHQEIRDDPGGKGQEIVKEVLACEGCVAKLKSEKGEQNGKDSDLQLQQVNKEHSRLSERRTGSLLSSKGSSWTGGSSNN